MNRKRFFRSGLDVSIGTDRVDLLGINAQASGACTGVVLGEELFAIEHYNAETISVFTAVDGPSSPPPPPPLPPLPSPLPQLPPANEVIYRSVRTPHVIELLPDGQCDINLRGDTNKNWFHLNYKTVRNSNSQVGYCQYFHLQVAINLNL